MNRTAHLWPIERVDGDGEPAPAGEYLKIGFRRFGDVTTAWLDVLDAEALAVGILALIARAEAEPKAPSMLCQGCAAAVLPGSPAYRHRPGGEACLVCEACAPTVAEEDAGIAAALEARVVPKGFANRVEAVTWRAKLRAAYSAQAKRLEPLVIDVAHDLAFPEPPASAVEVDGDGEDD